MRYYFEAMQQQHHALPPGEGVLNKGLYREAPPWGPIPYPLKYCKIPKNKPWGLYFPKALFEGLIFGGAYIRKREICVIKSVGLARSWKEIYHLCFVLLCTWGQILSTSPLGGLYSEGRFNGGFFALRSWGDLEGLMHGGAYFRNFTVPFWQKRYPALSYTFFWQNMVPLYIPI